MAGPFAPLVSSPHNQPPTIGTTITASRHSQTFRIKDQGSGSRVRIQDHNVQNPASQDKNYKFRIQDQSGDRIKATFWRVQELGQGLFQATVVTFLQLKPYFVQGFSQVSVSQIFWLSSLCLLPFDHSLTSTSIKIPEWDSLPSFSYSWTNNLFF